MKRIVEPELLDTLPPDDPRAIRSRRDLHRINWWMQNHNIVARALNENFPGAPRQITELGAGDGRFLLRVARKTAARWPDANVLLLDRQKNALAKTLAGFEKLGWRARAVVADVFNWPADSTDIVLANLFLHHLDDAQLRELFQTISRRAKLFVAVEPHRFRFALPCAQMLRLLGCSAVTRHDAAVSIRAGFMSQEISPLWPDEKNWRLTERRAGWFSHLFVAKKIS